MRSDHQGSLFVDALLADNLTRTRVLQEVTKMTIDSVDEVCLSHAESHLALKLLIALTGAQEDVLGAHRDHKDRGSQARRAASDWVRFSSNAFNSTIVSNVFRYTLKCMGAGLYGLRCVLSLFFRVSFAPMTLRLQIASGLQDDAASGRSRSRRCRHVRFAARSVSC